VTAIDIAPSAIATAQAISAPGLEIDYRVQDLFDMPRGPDRFDLVVEHCCYCAIDPQRRDAYIDAVADVLVPGGQLVGLFYAHGRPGGPPFTVDEPSLRESFARRFVVDALALTPDSVLTRMGEELLGRFTVR
jgi:SAM-dependent methyltransferase